MTYRYCPECDEWNDTADYEYNDVGWLICTEHDVSVHGCIPPMGPHDTYTEQEFKIDHSHMKDWSNELDAAKRQNLIREVSDYEYNGGY